MSTGLLLLRIADPDFRSREAHGIFLIENALNPMAFPSLLKMENEVVSVTASLTGGTDDTVGNLTSGGTESIFMALKAARDWARDMRPDVKDPEVVVPITVHPAWNKAAHYLGLKMIMTPMDDNYRADIESIKTAITPNTIILGGSAVSYPHGVVDPIEELGRQGFLELAQKAKRAAEKLIDGINDFSRLYVLGDPPATVFAIGSQSINIFELGIKLKERGWYIDFQHQPASLHMTVSPIHLSVADRFLDDLEQTIPDVPPVDSENISDTAAMYAMLGSTTDRLMAKDFALQYMNDLYRVK